MNKVHTQPNGLRRSRGQGTGGAARPGKSRVSEERLLQDAPAVEVPEVFQMPPVPTRRVLGRVHKAGPAPFVFVDDLADQSE